MSAWSGYGRGPGGGTVAGNAALWARLALAVLLVPGCGAGSADQGTLAGVPPVRAPSVHSPDFARKLTAPAAYTVNRERPVTESLCGPSDLQAVNSYNGALGQPAAFVALHKSPVGAMTGSATATGAKYCSGTLVGPDLFLTASHCVDSGTTADFVAFNYEKTTAGGGLAQQQFAAIKEVLEDGGGLDYALLRLDGSPGLRWGWASVRTYQAPVAELITVIQHPRGEAKQVEIGHVLDHAASYLRYADLDTDPGSSGSGILDGKGHLVGVHTNGGCTATGGSNSGVRLNAAAGAAWMSRLNALTLPFGQGNQIAITIANPAGGGALALTADPESGAVRLVPVTKAAPSSFGVEDVGDGAVVLTVARASGEEMALAAVTDGGIGLVPRGDSPDRLQRWRIVPVETGGFVLRAAVSPDGAQWLGARSAAPVLAQNAAIWRIDPR